ncbi:heme ABC transporter ATP-binding protein [Microaerobacter geothermalis]|uniref:heme ABC transporter ATP-binding protein n=1 Tax=Microaerobacter geothermalis TaxID=674972 RepID=UPI001F39A05F|nr:heme ABC transporter ATP-binding protein [Microaerobacter geothermalis]MCF6093668.1 heme ABC transporter ATP-binding protein [Microaerobacter geothermalis]
MIEVKQLTYSIHQKVIIQDISFCLRKGESLAVVGPNGSGKTTLLKAITGILQQVNGEIYIDGISVTKWNRKKLATKMAVLVQEGIPATSFTVEEVVRMGRYPHRGRFTLESAHDKEMIKRVMKAVDIETLKDKPIYKLSGGERQRVAFAKAMVQEPSILLLDEPTTFLDIGYQTKVLDLVKQWQKDCGLTILMILHDLNLAAQYGDRMMLIHEGKVKKLGSSDAVMNADLLEMVYGIRPLIIKHPKLGISQILPWPEQYKGMEGKKLVRF